MPIRFFCTECEAKLTVSRRYGGRRGRCPNCNAKVQVPEINVEDANLPIRHPHGSLDQSDSHPSLVRAKGTLRTELAEGAEASPSDASEIQLDQARELSEKIGIPRWVVYLQGALLGIVATSFFVFGMAVGSHTKIASTANAESGTCTVIGTVYFDDGNYREADYGAVVILLPTDLKPQQRPNAKSLRPNSFVPLDNPSIDQIRQLGGDVVRVNTDGSFQTDVESIRSYWVLSISKNKSTDSREIKKQVRAELGAYFFPIEDLLDDRAFNWTKVKLTGQQRRLESVVF